MKVVVLGIPCSPASNSAVSLFVRSESWGRLMCLFRQTTRHHLLALNHEIVQTVVRAQRALTLHVYTHAAHARSRCRCSACVTHFFCDRLMISRSTLLQNPVQPPVGSRRDSASLGSLFSTDGRVGKVKSDSCSRKGSVPPTLNKMPAETHLQMSHTCDNTRARGAALVRNREKCMLHETLVLVLHSSLY